MVWSAVPSNAASEFQVNSAAQSQILNAAGLSRLVQPEEPQVVLPVESRKQRYYYCYYH